MVAIASTLVSGAAGAGTRAPGAPGGSTTPTTAAPTPPGPQLRLTAQDPWTPVGGDLTLRLAITDPPAGAAVSFTAFQAITARKTYDATMRGGPSASVIGQVSVPIDGLPLDGNGDRVAVLGLQSPTEPRDVDRLNVRRAGVYPLEVDLRDADDRTVASFRSALVVSEADRETVAERLEVAWVWPISGPPSFLANGDRDQDVAASFRPDGRLGRMASALRSVPDVPVTLAPTAETTEAWAESSRGDPSIESTFASLLGAAATHPVLEGPYVPIDLPSLLDHDLGLAVDEVFARGTESLARTFGPTVDRRTRVLRPASTAALARVRVAGVDRVVVDAEALAPAPETRLTLAQPVTLQTGIAPDARPVSALVTDPGLQELLVADLPPAQRAQLILGGLTVVAQEAPSVQRVVTLLNPDSFDIPTAFYEALLTGLRNNPSLVPVTTTQAFDTVPVGPPAPTVQPGAASSERELATAASAEPAVQAETYRNQRARLNAFGAMTRPGDPAVGVADRSLLASVSSAWPLDIGRTRAAAHLAVVDREISAYLSRIEVPDPRTITLTSRSGEIPLTFRNETGSPIRLRASLASEKLFFPEGAVLDLELPPKSTTVRVAVEARTSGTFPLDLEVTSVDGVLPVSQRRLQVRSTFVSTVGVVLMASAVAFLALWWGFDIHRRRRRKRNAAA